MLFHNFSGYNSSVLLPGMVNLTKRLKKIKIMPKGATGYHIIIKIFIQTKSTYIQKCNVIYNTV